MSAGVVSCRFKFNLHLHPRQVQRPKMLVRLIRAYVSGARLENAARLGWARCYSTPIDDGPPKLTYPFFGNGETTSKQEQANKCIGRTGSDGYRYYAFSSDDGKYRLPSVTMVLSKTMAKSTQFALKNWKENLIKRHGPEGFEKISRDTVTRGTAFHKVHYSNVKFPSSD